MPGHWPICRRNSAESWGLPEELRGYGVKASETGQP
jgi:hypothetical protein